MKKTVNRKIRIRANFDRCTGCDICRLECSFSKRGGYNPRLALLRLENGADGLSVFPVVCHQCENAFCEKVCPHDAMVRDGITGVPAVSDEKCRKCGLCISYCPIKIIKKNESGQAQKCDLCGGEPLCVKACPTGALTLVREVESFEQQ